MREFIANWIDNDSIESDNLSRLVNFLIEEMEITT